ncbi:uncharacterized protein [Drosophila tropicalis]|uniref:uncharacterized protein n=1 Tax=Drosophila tropicalis TaxID=46794 RepID=UPI0035ABC77F
MAIRVFIQLAEDVQAMHPQASEILRNYMYVDDVLAGAHTEDDARLAIRDLQAAFKELIQAIPRKHLVRENFLELEDASTAKTLGTRWQAAEDVFFFTVADPPVKESIYKRQLVANRVSSISKSARGQSWSYVRSEDNSADLASRGVSAAELSSSSFWWHGPDWLRRDPEYSPTLNNELPDTQLEQRVQCHTTANTLLDDVSERFSDYGRALRVTAYILRVATKKDFDAFPVHLTNDELLSAERALIRNSQRREYVTEIRALGEGRPLPSSSTLLNFNPFLDQHGILCSCGRLRAAESLRTKAINLESTSDLTTERFLADFSRFVTRRQCPQRIYSDNGKNFVGAFKALEKDFLDANKPNIMKAFPHHILSWQFIPPSAPHMGGLFGLMVMY